jgi:hypothetical protein
MAMTRIGRRSLLDAPLALLPRVAIAQPLPHADRLHYQAWKMPPYAGFAPLWIEIAGTPRYQGGGWDKNKTDTVSPATFAAIERYVTANGHSCAKNTDLPLPAHQPPVYLFSLFQGMVPVGCYLMPPEKVAGFLDLALPPPAFPSGPNIS